VAAHAEPPSSPVVGTPAPGDSRPAEGSPADVPPTTGIAAVDALIDGPRISDNLVVLAPAAAPLERLVSTFVAANAPVRPVVVASTDAAPPPTGAEHLDWRAVPSGGAAATDLWSVDDRLGAGAAYVVDSLSGLAARLGHDAALELFLATCPRLYLRRSIALWPVRADQHPPAVLGRLAAITQVVLHLTEVAEGWQVEVQQAAGRAATTVGRRVVLREGPEGFEPAGPVTSGRERLGVTIRAQRTMRGLSQAELARRIGISPSALSQVERGVRGLSGESLMRVWEALDVPFGPTDTRLLGFRVARRGGQSMSRSSGGVTTRTLLDDPTIGGVHRVRLAPRASGRGFDTKGEEVVVVLDGVVDLEVGGHPVTLQAGDTLVATDATVGAVSNPAEVPAELLWMVHGWRHRRGV
jgi:DNA-binding XRE family transcriptional regulator/quercetin dioxygenase-like cupin family protein